MARKVYIMAFRRERLKAAREKMGFSQAELCKRCGLSAKQIWRYEREDHDPSIDVLPRIAKELGVSTDWLLGLTDTPTAIIPDIPPRVRHIAERLSKLPESTVDLLLRLAEGKE